jgi:FkbM family methyltransferase
MLRILTRLGVADALRDLRSLAVGLRREERDRRRQTLEFFSDFMGPGDLVFDVGANVGDRTAVFRELDARVVAVEPQPECVRRLRRRFRNDPAVTVEAEALGREEGIVDMAVSSASHTLSSLSPEWMDAVRESGRFSDVKWDGTQQVRVTTLDALIKRYGKPSFCKIDVEGYELDVLLGLTESIRALSFEFVPEFAGVPVKCVERLIDLGDFSFNYCRGQEMRLAFNDWVDQREIIGFLSGIGEPRAWGDVYARLF